MNPISNARDAAQIHRRGLPAVISIVCSVHFLAACEDGNWARANLNTTAWAQTSEEYRAIALGSYAQAQRMLDLALDDEEWTAIPGQKLTDEDGKPLPMAVILDVDETALDNLQYAAWLVKNNKTYSDATWNRWVMDMKAPAIPGAVDFVRYARDRDVKVFFVTNRLFKDRLEDGGELVELKLYTVQNLKDTDLLPAEGTGEDDCVSLKRKLGVDGSVLMKRETDEWKSDKTSRRDLIAECYRVALLVGDVLGDFIGYEKDGEHLDFYRQDETGLDGNQRRNELRIYQQYWGKQWIMLPNPGYGSWESSLYDFDYGLPPEEKGQRKLDALTSWTDDELHRPECQAIYDAGSTGTRLYIYYKENGSWTEVAGPKTSKKLADGIANKKIVPEVVGLLDDIRTDAGFENPFDWQKQCSGLSSIRLLATAGMRLAERSNEAGSKTLWEELRNGLHEAYGRHVEWPDITTRTISGYEEGIYAWLAVRHAREKYKINSMDFGVAEMGGGSIQVTFPCGENCTNLKTVVVDEKEAPLSVHSFLKLGTDQLPGSLTFDDVPPECAWGLGPKSDTVVCKGLIKNALLNNSGEIYDPILKKHVRLPPRDHVAKWYLAGSFFYMNKEDTPDVFNCCENKFPKNCGCFDEENSCFVAIFRPLLLEALGINESDAGKAAKIQTSWTMGAAICDESDCLQKTGPRTCPWRTASRCLEPPAAPTI